jgi:cell division protein FtsZ
MMLFEVDQAANRIRAEVDPDANIIFGGTILENMEGRLRVSVVATGIEAEALSQMPKNVEPLRPRSKPVPVPASPPMPHISPVHRQVQTLASEMNTPASPAPVAMTAVETMLLGGAESPVMEEDIPVAPVAMRPAPTRPAPQPEPEPLEEKRRRFGFLGRKEKKPEPRLEPQPAARTAAPQRATAQVIQRGVEPQRQPQQGTAEDLFPDHKKDDQFEIPAFLRRQTN